MLKANKVVIVGTGAAGRSAAVSIKRVNPSASVFLIGEESNLFIRCSAPYVISNENKLKDLIKPWKNIIDLGIRLVQEKVIDVDMKNMIVKTKTKEYFFDSLVFATGASPFIPPIKGIDLKNIFTLRNSKDAQAILKASQKAKNAVVVGGGAIGTEVAAALAKRKISTTLIEVSSCILENILNKEYSKIIEKRLKNNNIKVLTKAGIKEIIGDKKVQAVRIKNKFIPADFVVFACGVKSNTELAKKAGIKIGKFGIKVDKYLQTNFKNVYAAGDCAESYCPFTKKEIPTRLAPRAVLEGKIAGKNVAGLKIEIPLTIAPFSMEIFGLQIGSVGINEKRARNDKLPILIGQAESLTRHDSMERAKPIKVKLIFNKQKEIIGGTVMGEEAVAQRLNLISLAISKKCTIDDLVKLEYTSCPDLTPLPFAEPIVMAAEEASFN